MKFYDLKSFYIVTDIKEHQENKDKLLSLIDDMRGSSYESISKTDWHLPRETPRPYLDLIYTILRPYMMKMSDRLGLNSWTIYNGWFQQYGKHGVHNWHVHEGVNYANVYFLNLPDESIKTQFFDIKERKVMNEIDVREGQLLTFPAHIKHRSPENTSDEVKTIISFNSDFYDEQ